MKATSLRFHQREVDLPLSAAEEALIRDIFKPVYVPQIQCWALMRGHGQRRRLFDFISGAQEVKETRPVTVFASPQLQRDFRLNSANSQINLGFSFNPRPMSRQNNRDRFASPGTIEVFHEEKVDTQSRAKPNEEESLATFMVRKLMNGRVVEKFRALANANYSLLQELTQWVERRNTNPFPVDPLIQHPTLSPFSECRANDKRNREDHLARPNIPPLPYNVQSGPSRRSTPWKTPPTQYTCFFENDERFEKSYLSGPFPPFEQSQPFGKFPPERREKLAPAPEDTQDLTFTRQAAEDTVVGRQYKTIFESRTCL
jgi:hypothetical protein